MIMKCSNLNNLIKSNINLLRQKNRTCPLDLSACQVKEKELLSLVVVEEMAGSIMRSTNARKKLLIQWNTKMTSVSSTTIDFTHRIFVYQLIVYNSFQMQKVLQPTWKKFVKNYRTNLSSSLITLVIIPNL